MIQNVVMKPQDYASKNYLYGAWKIMHWMGVYQTLAHPISFLNFWHKSASFSSLIFPIAMPVVFAVFNVFFIILLLASSLKQ